jgi:hypothetical protein
MYRRLRSNQISVGLLVGSLLAISYFIHVGPVVLQTHKCDFLSLNERNKRTRFNVFIIFLDRRPEDDAIITHGQNQGQKKN